MALVFQQFGLVNVDLRIHILKYLTGWLNYGLW